MVNTWYRVKAEGIKGEGLYISRGQAQMLHHLKELGLRVVLDYCPYCLCAQYEMVDGVERCLRCHRLKRG